MLKFEKEVLKMRNEEQIEEIAEKIKKDVVKMLKDYEKANKDKINLDNETLEKTS